MTTKTLPILALPVMLLACAPTRWDSPPGYTDAQFHRDNFECAGAAHALVGDSFAMGPPLFVAAAEIGHDNAMRDATAECLLGKGYTKHVGD